MPTPSKPDTWEILDRARPYIENELSKEGLRKIIRDLCGYIDAQKVTAEQIRAHVASSAAIRTVDVGTLTNTSLQGTYVDKKQLLDFIDNGPPKPTVSQIVAKRMYGTDDLHEENGKCDGHRLIDDLRESGYLREDV